MESVREILGTFEPITLKEMDSVSLLSRFDTKYIFNINRLPQILENIRQGYRVLDIKNVRLNKYETLYFDTKEHHLYSQHQRGVLSRYKVRYRHYTDTGVTYFEVKFKNNKNKTVKERIKQENVITDIKGEAEKFLAERVGIEPCELLPRLWVYYYRILLANRHMNERVTIDLCLHFRNNNTDMKYPLLVIAESKKGRTGKSDFVRLMKEMHIRDESVSKYCLGIALLNDSVKKNYIKDKIKSINKYGYE